MHRHGYKGRKFGRERDQREALIKSLADSLVLHEKIETTLPKAKEIVPYIEKLITKAKLGTLHARRQVISGLMTTEAAHKLVDDIAPKLGGRVSGHVRITKGKARRGDNVTVATVSFVDDLSVEAKKPAATKPEVKKAAAKPAAKKSTAKPKAKKGSK
jgi:large subunit ribosomal protein L17